jgi:hypothetical protein
MALSTKQIEILKRIRESKMRGYVKVIAAKVGKSPNYVQLALSPNSKFYNHEIINEAVKIIAEREKQTNQLLEKLPELEEQGTTA